MKQNKQRKAAGLLAALLVIALILSLAAPLFSSAQAMTVAVEKSNSTSEGNIDAILPAQEIGQEQFLLEMRAGYADSYILGKPTPFQGILTNLGSDFNGEIQIKAYSSYEYYSEGDKKYTMYYQPLELAKGAKKQVNLKVTADAIHKYFQVTLVNSQGETVFLKNIATQAMEPATSFVGVLTDSAQDLAYLSGLKLVENGDGVLYASKTIYMDETIFPEDSDFLKNFGIVMIDDFDTKLLSAEQKDALKSWVQTGGTLVLGTGAKAEKVLGGLTHITPFQIEEKKRVNTLSSLGYPKGYGEVDIAPILGEGLQEVYQESGVGITSAMAFGGGKIIVHNFSLSSAPVTTIPDFATALRSMYVKIMPSLKISQSDTENNDMNTQYIANNFPALKTEGIYIIFICILIYLAFIGPILYYFLKKKDKREWGWVAIPALSLTFMGIVFLLSQNSLYRKNIMNIVSVTDINQDASVANTKISAALKTASSGAVTFSMKEPISVSFYDSYRGGYGRYGKDKPIRKILSGDGTEVTFYDNQSWATNTFMTNTSVDLGGKLESTIALDGNIISGEVINHTNMDFYGVVIGTAGNFQRFDQLKAGESLKISYNMKESMPSRKGVYEMVDEIFDGINDRRVVRKHIKEGTLGANEAYHLYQQKNLVEDSIQTEYYEKQQNLETGILPIIMYAFNDTPVLPQKKYINGDLVLERNLGFYLCKFDLDLSHSEDVNIPFGLIYPARFESEYTVNRDVYTNYLYPDKAGEVDCLFQMPKGIDISMFQVKAQADMVSFYKEPEIYHVTSNTWEPMKAEEYQNVEEYLTAEGMIRVRIFINEVREVAMPEIRLKGRGSNAGN